MIQGLQKKSYNFGKKIYIVFGVNNIGENICGFIQ